MMRTENKERRKDETEERRTEERIETKGGEWNRREEDRKHRKGRQKGRIEDIVEKKAVGQRSIQKRGGL